MSTEAVAHPFNQKKRIATLWLISILLGIVIVVAQPGLFEASYQHEMIETVGLGLVIAAVMGRLWSILYIGAKKNTELVTLGPYSMTRNPLYLFSITGLVGIGLMFGSLAVTLALLLISIVVFRYTALKEAAFLRATFGEAYDAYAARTPLIMPNVSHYKSSADITFSAKALARTFRDCIPFLALYPLIEMMEMLHANGMLKTLVYLP